MPKQVSITLYHSHQCYHCVKFMPEWEALKTMFQTETDLSTSEMEASEMSRESFPKINGKTIEGFPTMKITIKENGKVIQEQEYTGKRRAVEIREAMNAMRK